MTAQAIQTSTPSLTDALRETAMLAKVTCTALGLTRLDKRASRDMEAQRGAPEGSFRGNVNRLGNADALHKLLRKVQDEAQENLNNLSTAWGTGGRRLLPNANFEKWVKKHYELDQEFKTYLAQLEEQVDAILAAAAEGVKNFDVKPPEREELLGSYSMSYALEPVPDATFPGVPDAAHDWLTRQYEANNASHYQEGLNAAFKRFLKPLGKLVERIDAYDNKDNDERRAGGTFKNTLVTNIQDVLDAARSFNLAGDPVVDDFIKSMEIFGNIHADDLRKDENLRTSVKTKAQETIDRLSDMLGGF